MMASELTNDVIVNEYYECMYNQENIIKLLESKYQIPNIIIGLNSGLLCYDTWSEMINRINKYKIKAVFTEYALLDMIAYTNQYPNLSFNTISNPFRNPTCSVDNSTAKIWSDNAFLCGFNIN